MHVPAPSVSRRPCAQLTCGQWPTIWIAPSTAHAEGKPVPHVACVTCKLAVDLGRFVDIADAKEFMISGMCLTCQELVFGTANRLPEWAR